MRSRTDVGALAIAALLSACVAGGSAANDAGRAIDADAGPTANDAGRAIDADAGSTGIDAGCRAGDPPPDAFGECVTHYGGGWCSDAREGPVCVDGAWSCPTDTTLTSPADPCWCYGAPPPGCSCVTSGWSCADAGLTP